MLFFKLPPILSSSFNFVFFLSILHGSINLKYLGFNLAPKGCNRLKRKFDAHEEGKKKIT
jgi:hypothetical protein